VDERTGTYLIGPDFSISLPRLPGDPVEMQHAAGWLAEPLPSKAAFVAFDLRSERSLQQLFGPRRTEEVVASVGRRISEVRQDDVVFRLRDDVFLVAVEDFDCAAAGEFAHEFRNAIAWPAGPDESPTGITFGATIAVACRTDERSPAQLLEKLEKVLAHANETGSDFSVNGVPA
jgi:GGDEF domain-containing protein